MSKGNRVRQPGDRLFEHTTGITPTDFDRAFSLFFAAWIVWALICVGAMGLLGYVAYHFITKYW